MVLNNLVITMLMLNKEETKALKESIHRNLIDSLTDTTYAYLGLPRLTKEKENKLMSKMANDQDITVHQEQFSIRQIQILISALKVEGSKLLLDGESIDALWCNQKVVQYSAILRNLQIKGGQYIPVPLHQPKTEIVTRELGSPNQDNPNWASQFVDHPSEDDDLQTLLEMD